MLLSAAHGRLMSNQVRPRYIKVLKINLTCSIKFSTAPTIVVAPQNHKVEIGNTIFMSCVAHIGTLEQDTDMLTTIFTWWGPNNQVLTDSDEVQYFNDTSTQGGRVFVRSILKICRFRENNAGQYICRVDNENGNENRTWTTTFPQTPLVPQLAAVSSYEDVNNGNTVYMACAVYGYPQPEITWTRNDEVIDAASSTVATTIVTINNANFTQSILRVCGFQAANSGLYKCNGSSLLGNTIGYMKVALEGKL